LSFVGIIAGLTLFFLFSGGDSNALQQGSPIQKWVLRCDREPSVAYTGAVLLQYIGTIPANIPSSFPFQCSANQTQEVETRIPPGATGFRVTTTLNYATNTLTCRDVIPSLADNKSVSHECIFETAPKNVAADAMVLAQANVMRIRIIPIARAYAVNSSENAAIDQRFQ
jgi:hypothetical protein